MSVSEERIDRGRLFQIDGTANEKERLPKDLFVEGGVSVRGTERSCRCVDANKIRKIGRSTKVDGSIGHEGDLVCDAGF